MSLATSVYSITLPLVKARDFIRTDKTWVPTNQAQDWYVKNIYPQIKNRQFGFAELKYIATPNAKDLTLFFKRNGFEFDVQPFITQPKYYEFGTGAVLDVFAKWVTPGTPTKINKNGKKFDAINLWSTGNTNKIKLFNPPLDMYRGGEDLVVAIETQRPGERIFLYKHHQAPVSSLDLILKANKILSASKPIFYSGDIELSIPMIDLDLESDISWLKKLYTYARDGRKCELILTEQKNRLKLNETGVKAQSATYMKFSTLSKIDLQPRLVKRLIFDEPFYILITRSDLVFPLFCGYITPEQWKVPTIV